MSRAHRLLSLLTVVLLLTGSGAVAGNSPSITGKWRIETIEINGEIVVAGVRVAPGDIVLADDTGVCFIPRARAAEVLSIAQKKSAAEEAKCQAIDAGTPVADLSA